MVLNVIQRNVFQCFSLLKDKEVLLNYTKKGTPTKNTVILENICNICQTQAAGG